MSYTQNSPTHNFTKEHQSHNSHNSCVCNALDKTLHACGTNLVARYNRIINLITEYKCILSCH